MAFYHGVVRLAHSGLKSYLKMNFTSTWYITQSHK